MKTNEKIIKLCYFCSVSTFNSGMPISTFKLIKHFSSDPVFDVFCIFPSEGDFPQRARECGAKVTIIPFKGLRKGFAFFYSLTTWFSAIVHFSHFIRKNGIHLVHFSDLIDLPYYPSLLFSNAKCIAHIRMNIEHSLLRFLYSIWVSLFCHSVICISESVKKHAGLTPKNSTIIYNPGPDPALFNPETQQSLPPGFNSSRYNILSIANFREVKGQEHFITMASIIESTIPDKAHYILVGDRLPSHFNYFNYLQELIRKNNLASKFTILEHIRHESIPSIITHSFVLVHLPNYQEGFGGVILEAMIMGTPVIAFDSGGISECFTDKYSGFIVAQYNASLAADALITLLQNPAQRDCMGNNARQEVRKFSYSKHFSEITHIYNGLTN